VVHNVRKDSFLSFFINIFFNMEVNTFNDFFFFCAQETEETPI